MKNRLFLVGILCLFYSCTQPKVDNRYKIIGLFERIDTNKNNSIKEDITIIDLYEDQMNKCDSLLDYTGNLYLRFDTQEKVILFQSSKDSRETIIIKLTGYLCPNSSKDILFSEYNITPLNSNITLISNDTVQNDTLQNRIEKFLLNSTNDYASYPYIFQIIGNDTLKISQLNIIMNSIMLGYIQFCENLLVTKDIGIKRENFPFRVKVLPNSVFKGKVPRPHQDID